MRTLANVTVEDFATIGRFHRCTNLPDRPLRVHRRIDCNHPGCAPFSKIVTERETKSFGINAIGLERKGFSPERLQALKRAYRLLVRAKLNTSQALVEIRKSLGDSARAGIDQVYRKRRARHRE